MWLLYFHGNHWQKLKKSTIAASSDEPWVAGNWEAPPHVTWEAEFLARDSDTNNAMVSLRPSGELLYLLPYYINVRSSLRPMETGLYSF